MVRKRAEEKLKETQFLTQEKALGPSGTNTDEYDRCATTLEAVKIESGRGGMKTDRGSRNRISITGTQGPGLSGMKTLKDFKIC